jgi:hypothetical protein
LSLTAKTNIAGADVETKGPSGARENCISREDAIARTQRVDLTATKDEDRLRLAAADRRRYSANGLPRTRGGGRSNRLARGCPYGKRCQAQCNKNTAHEKPTPKIQVCN